MSLQLYIAPNLEDDLLCLDGCALGNVTQFEAFALPGVPIEVRYDMVGSEFTAAQDPLKAASRTWETHPLIIELQGINTVEVRFRDARVSHITELTVYMKAEPRSRLIRIVFCRIDEALRKELVQLKGVEIVINHVAEEAPPS